MITDFTSKNIKHFICEKCNFNCSKKGDYNRHLMTAKHKMITNDNNNTSKNITSYSCICGKIYKYASGLSRHLKICSHNINNSKEIYNTNELTTTNVKTTDKDQLILDLLAQNKELITMLNETIPKIGNTTNNTTNNNNQFNLNVFLNEDCKDAINFSEFIENMKVSFEDLEHQAEVGYINGVSKLFIENLRDLGTHKRPIHCTDKKRKTLYIKENNEWDKEGSQNTLEKGIREVSRKGLECLTKEKEENQEEYKDIESNFSQKCLSIHRSILPSIPQDTTISKVIEKISQNSGINE
jgi:hypothetical protein